MTVQQIIDELVKIEDKTIEVRQWSDESETYVPIDAVTILDGSKGKKFAGIS
jgi:hypothetical protein